MLTPAAIAIAVTAPLILAMLLWLALRRSAGRWQASSALLLGISVSFPLNALFLRCIPLMLAEGHAKAASAREAWASAFLEAAIPEELAKGFCILALLLFCSKSSPHAGALLGGLVGLGFSLSENLSFALFVPEWRVMAGVGHGAWGIILGTLLQAALTCRAWRFAWIAWALVPPILLHGLIDASIFLVDAYEVTHGVALEDKEVGFDLALAVPMLTTVVAELLGIIWAVRIMRRVRRATQRAAEPPIAAAPQS